MEGDEVVRFFEKRQKMIADKHKKNLEEWKGIPEDWKIKTNHPLGLWSQTDLSMVSFCHRMTTSELLKLGYTILNDRVLPKTQEEFRMALKKLEEKKIKEEKKIVEFRDVFEKNLPRIIKEIQGSYFESEKLKYMKDDGKTNFLDIGSYGRTFQIYWQVYPDLMDKIAEALKIPVTVNPIDIDKIYSDLTTRARKRLHEASQGVPDPNIHFETRKIRVCKLPVMSSTDITIEKGTATVGCGDESSSVVFDIPEKQ